MTPGEMLPCGWCGQPTVVRPEGIRCACTPTLSASEHLAEIRACKAEEKEQAA